ncbi:RecT family recombinase [Mangrovibrevibacter kandeliae]|uniref:RecT family recombinase n=1 Tax=Mangrovibrevibacter kandeliae TaxID=2968473 RepID=UPI0035563E6D
MSNALVANEPRSVLNTMSERYGMEPAAFEATVRATCMKPQGGKEATREEFAAFLLVAKEYGLNPLTKEIYAFPAKGGGIVPVVSIDGWVNLIQSHPACDGFEFEDEHDADGNLISCTCTIYRKDRSRPVRVTEYLVECIRATDPWKMKHRMLRHKTLIQGARYAFGFGGVYDEDEAAKIAEIKDVTPPTPPAPPAPPKPEGNQKSSPSVEHKPEQEQQPNEQKRANPPAPPKGNGSKTIEHDPFDDVVQKLDSALAKCGNKDELGAVWKTAPAAASLTKEQDDRLIALRDKHVARIKAPAGSATAVEQKTEEAGKHPPADVEAKPFDLTTFKAEILQRLESAQSADEADQILMEVDGAIEEGFLTEAQKEEHFVDAISTAFERLS